jgi:hypothetical protein
MISAARLRGVLSAVVFLVLSILMAHPTAASASFARTGATPAATTAVLSGYDVPAKLLAAANMSKSTARRTTPAHVSAPTVSRVLSSAGVAAEGAETELVQRAMSRAELQATQDTGLIRGGRDGTSYVSDNVNSNALRARQRLALPQTPEVRVTLEVPSGAFSPPKLVDPLYDMPGGGMERMGSGQIACRVVAVLDYC